MTYDAAPPSRIRLPSVDRVLRSAETAPLIAKHGRQQVTKTVRAALQLMREDARSAPANVPDVQHLVDAVSDSLDQAAAPTLKRVMNLTGTVLHTNLGRAALPESAVNAISEIARGASTLEYDLEAGARGKRDSHAEPIVAELTGAEAAVAVNNNAAAVMLVLNTMALGSEVPVSRGELVEIGGSFRIPEIMSRSGCRLLEVGTTNRTYPKDYEQAIGPETGLIMKVHPSNYAIEGFTKEVPEADIAAICRANDLPFVVDLGAGSLIDLERFGLPHEPTPSETLKAGADLVTFSGDKLLGGPQAGLIVGRKDLIDRLRANPMMRALRCDKMTIAALAAVLHLYRDPDRLAERLPTLRALTRPLEEIENLARSLVGPMIEKLGDCADISVVMCDSVIGSGALPTRTIGSCGIAIKPRGKESGGGKHVDRIAKVFRDLPTPVIGRVHKGALILDLRPLEQGNEFLELIDLLAPVENSDEGVRRANDDTDPEAISNA